MSGLTKHIEIDYWEEGQKNEYRWYKKGIYKRLTRKKQIRAAARQAKKDAIHEHND